MDKQVNWQQLAEGFKAERDIIQEQLIQARQEIAWIRKLVDELQSTLLLHAILKRKT